MPKCTRVGDQWKRCDRCAILTPHGRLMIDKGLLLCDRPGCRDIIQDEYHLKHLSAIMSVPTDEGMDRTALLYFAPEDWDGDN